MERIYTAYSGKVLGYIRARIQNYADAEDLQSEVFEKVFRKFADYDPEKAAVGTWIFTITRNTVIDYYRKTKPTEELDEELADNSAVDDSLQKVLSQYVDNKMICFNNISKKRAFITHAGIPQETLSELAKALNDLPQQMREIIVLRYYDGKPLTEIAQLLGLSYGAVKLRHQNGVEMLRRVMRKNFAMDAN